MQKVSVKICIGTTCFVLGASELQSIEDHLSPDITRDVEITGTSCLGVCKDQHYQRVPCAMIDDTLYESLSLPDLVQAIEDTVRLKRQEDSEDEH